MASRGVYTIIMAEIEGRLRTAIQQSGQTRASISRATGISEAHLSRFVGGTRGLGLDIAKKLADYLGLEIIIKPRRKAR